MTKSVLIEKVTEKVEGLTKKQVEAIINTVFDGMKDALARGEKIEIRGLGRGRVRAVAVPDRGSGRKPDGRNPAGLFRPEQLGCGVLRRLPSRRKGAGARQKSTSLQDRQAIPSLPQ